jgi:hypothetical protein
MPASMLVTNPPHEMRAAVVSTVSREYRRLHVQSRPEGDRDIAREEVQWTTDAGETTL